MQARPCAWTAIPYCRAPESGPLCRASYTALPMKRIGITGPPGSGKTTLWRAITGGETSGEIATVEVPEPRLDKLVELHASRSRVAAHLEVVDVHAGSRTPSAATARLREMDAIVAVLPTFGGQDPTKELSSLTDELILADMGPVDTRLHRAKKDPAARQEVPALEAAADELGAGRFLAIKEWDVPDLAVFSPLALITLKPLIVVYNVDESHVGDLPPSSGFSSFAASASLEAEVAGLDQEEARVLLEAYGVAEPVLGKVIVAVYRSLDLITFLTTSDKESRAWEVRRGATAPEAAGVIHSDLQRGFIRAEVVSFDSLVQAGSWDAAKSKGLVRVEGKDYVFQEGDVTHFRFAV